MRKDDNCNTWISLPRAGLSLDRMTWLRAKFLLRKLESIIFEILRLTQNTTAIHLTLRYAYSYLFKMYHVMPELRRHGQQI